MSTLLWEGTHGGGGGERIGHRARGGERIGHREGKGEEEVRHMNIEEGRQVWLHRSSERTEGQSRAHK